MKHEDVPVEKIHFGKRYRHDDGDIEALAANIRDVGLLHAIAVDQHYNLICGSRRLQACADILKWKTIPCAVLNLKSILAGEYSENQFRKDFTPSELVEISKALEEEDEKLRKQQGKRTDLSRGGDIVEGSLVQNVAQVPGEKTRSKVAKAAGFGNPETMAQARKVVARGAPEVIKAMDSGEVSISAAAAIASQPKKDQAEIVAMPKNERQTAIRDIRKAKAEREANERRARDLRLFRGLYNAVHFLATFTEDAVETWAGISRVSAYKFADELPAAIECLLRIRKGHPNEARRPRLAP